MVDVFPTLLRLTQVKVKFFFYYFKIWLYRSPIHLLNIVFKSIFKICIHKFNHSTFLAIMRKCLHLGSEREKSLIFVWKIENLSSYISNQRKKNDQNLSWLILVFVTIRIGIFSDMLRPREKRLASLSDLDSCSNFWLLKSASTLKSCNALVLLHHLTYTFIWS